MKFSLYSIESHYLTRQHVILCITIVLLFFNIKLYQSQVDRFSIIYLNMLHLPLIYKKNPKS